MLCSAQGTGFGLVVDLEPTILTLRSINVHTSTCTGRLMNAPSVHSVHQIGLDPFRSFTT